MSITSLHFILFVIATLGFYYIFPKFQKLTLILSSILFLLFLDLQLFLLIVILLLIIFFILFSISRQENHFWRKLLLVIGLTIILTFMWMAKYFDFSLSLIQKLMPTISIQSSSLLELTSTIGISFITFKLISTLIDFYKNKTKQVSVPNFVLHNTFFPEFLAGPIQRYVSFSPQLSTVHTINTQNIIDGSERILLGIFKKLVIANGLAVYVNMIYANPSQFSSWNVLLAIYLFAFQLLFDFSGYTDIAIGVGKLFDIVIPENFNLPYTACSVREFWRRWHITLSSWFRDYVYIPLGGNRMGMVRTIGNVLIVFFLTGIWHGASWNFVIWGLLHGLLITIEIILSKLSLNVSGKFKHVSTLIHWFLTFNIVVFLWVFFRSDSITEAVSLIKYSLSTNGSLTVAPSATIAALIGFGVASVLYNSTRIAQYHTIKMLLRRLGIVLAICLIAFISVSAQADFIYFKF